ncbi:MAG: recombinase family protein [Bacilli bacterium]|nr:recombinase family protein [Bacilli bacterium]
MIDEYYKNSIYNNKLRVVYYARVSTDDRTQATSIINQTNYFDNYIKSINNWTLVGKYIDEGISGKNINNRINFKKMIEDGLLGKYDLILTKSVSRFARNTIDSIRYTDLLKEKGIGVYFINDNINTFSSDSEFRLTLMASLAQDELRKLSESVKFGLRQSIDRGIVLGNNNILGYKKDNGKLVIDEKEAIIVREIFTLFDNGKYTYSDIARLINNKYNKKMDSTSVKRVLTNYKYKGYYCGRKSTVVNYKRGIRKRYDVGEWLIYKDNNNVPVIIEEKIWDRVNKLILKKNKLRNNGKYDLYCTIHNCKCRYVVKKYKKNIYKYYMCLGCFSIREELIDEMVGLNHVKSIYICNEKNYLKVYILFIC